MKTTTTPYTIAARSVIFDVNSNVSVRFRNGTAYEGPLSGLRQFAIDHQCDAPQECRMEDGRHGLYPCIVALDEQMATALSVLRGEKIAVGDGPTFSGRVPLRKALSSLAAAGVTVPVEAMKWGVTEQAYTEQPTAPTAKPLDLGIPF